VGEIENLFARVQLSHTARSKGLFEFPMKCKLEKLCRVTIQAHNKANIQRKTNKAYMKKTKKDKKVQSKARVLTQGDVDILRQEEEERKAK